jgi:hypothetical protein
MNRSPLFLAKLSFLLLLIVCSKDSFSQYKISDIIDANKISIKPPYKYDGFLMNEFTFSLINKTIPLEFVAFKKQEYKLIFCSSGFEESMTISIYDKNVPAVKIAEKIINGTSKEWTFEPQQSGTYSIVYEIPPSDTDVEHKGCMVMLIGFKGK